MCLHPLSGARESAINRAEGLRQSKILASEAVRIEQLNKAKGNLLQLLGNKDHVVVKHYKVLTRHVLLQPEATPGC